jgi:hypothetical protein
VIEPAVIDEAFAKVSHAFPFDADWQGTHFRYAVKNGVTLIEQKRSVFVPESECGHCGQHRGHKETRYFYWLLIGERFFAVHASEKSKFGPLRTVKNSFSPSTNYMPTT